MKTIVITGASSGFGAAVAKRFAVSGNRLVLLARRRDRLETLAAELQMHCPVHIDTLDVTDSRAMDTCLSALPQAFTEVDVLINNAGLALGLEPAYEANLTDWDTMVSTNINGLMHMTRRILPGMVARNRGHIINIGSIAGSWPYPGGNVYGATKAFVQQFSRGLRSDLLGTAVRVSNIEPGMAETEFSEVRFKGDQDNAQKVYHNTCALSADDVAGVIEWVADTPPHVNINSLEVMPVTQAWGPLAVDRSPGSDES